MRVSVIVSTYNQPAWLEKVLWGYSVQRYRDFELIIADDGSGPETAAVIARVCKEARLNARHVWHEDRGFRKCEILNRAILAAAGDYLIFSDGDCIPRNDFVETHVRLAEPHRFLGGTVIRISRKLSEQVSIDDIRTGRFADRVWLLERGHRMGRRALKLMQDQRLPGLVDAITTTPARFDGCNASTWRDALLAIDGFDMEMGYGWEDRTLGYRLRHFGFRSKQVRNRAICIHLEHDRPYKTGEGMQRNRAIRDRVIKNREVYARSGIAELCSTGREAGLGPR